MRKEQKLFDIDAAVRKLCHSFNYEAQYGLTVWLVTAPFESRLARAMNAVIASKLAAAIIQDLARPRKAWGWNSESGERRTALIRRALEARLAQPEKRRNRKCL